MTTPSSSKEQGGGDGDEVNADLAFEPPQQQDQGMLTETRRLV